uniref:Uncharacterized protein n=1 Tax=Alsidium seaforthii TaxID=2007182 RepID=A0A1Z1MDL3_9FLOR|nr:hypothetical protein [Bryothamnion seaforthii]ARW63881.1 hypothetical protein [Bryothamnion seaforthii]
MFLFKRHCQYKSWETEHQNLKRQFRQSYEAIYTDKEGFLNYKKMVCDIQKKIDEGENKFIKRKRNITEHSKKQKFDMLKNYIEEYRKEKLICM